MSKCISVTKSMTFDAAHMLTDYKGECSNLHGHTYTVQATVAKPVSIPMGFVIDYNELEMVLRSIVKPMDHAFIVGKARGSAEDDIKLMCEKHHLKLYELNEARSSSENIACELRSKLQEAFKEAEVSIKLWETPTSFCNINSIEV